MLDLRKTPFGWKLIFGSCHKTSVRAKIYKLHRRPIIEKMRQRSGKGEIERKILSYLSLKGKERVEKLRRAIGASKSFYRTLEKLRDEGFIEIQKVSHKERYVILKRGANKRLLTLLDSLKLPPTPSFIESKAHASKLLKEMERQVLLLWWSFIRSVAAKRSIRIYVTTAKEEPRDMKPIRIDHIIEPFPEEVRDLIDLMLDIHESFIWELSKSDADKIFYLAKEKCLKLQKC